MIKRKEFVLGRQILTAGQLCYGQPKWSSGPTVLYREELMNFLIPKESQECTGALSRAERITGTDYKKMEGMKNYGGERSAVYPKFV